ncbi:MAG: hypothetical protein GEU90_09875 [Gemmatimonas sp.]|nr:hypothetical protein [Gemmatimonas sp.]
MRTETGPTLPIAGPDRSRISYPTHLEDNLNMGMQDTYRDIAIHEPKNKRLFALRAQRRHVGYRRVVLNAEASSMGLEDVSRSISPTMRKSNRPSIPPPQKLKALLVQGLSVRSNHQSIEPLDCDLLIAGLRAYAVGSDVQQEPRKRRRIATWQSKILQ